MTAQEFVRRAVSAAADYRTLYVSGGFGAPLVGRNVERYCTNSGAPKPPETYSVL